MIYIPITESPMNKKDLIRTISQELELPISQEKITLVLDKARG